MKQRPRSRAPSRSRTMPSQRGTAGCAHSDSAFASFQRASQSRDPCSGLAACARGAKARAEAALAQHGVEPPCAERAADEPAVAGRGGEAR